MSRQIARAFFAPPNGFRRTSKLCGRWLLCLTALLILIAHSRTVSILCDGDSMQVLTLVTANLHADHGARQQLGTNSTAGMQAHVEDAFKQAICKTTHRGAKDKLSGSPYTFLCPAALKCVYNQLMCLQHHSVELVTRCHQHCRRIRSKQ